MSEPCATASVVANGHTFVRMSCYDEGAAYQCRECGYHVWVDADATPAERVSLMAPDTCEITVLREPDPPNKGIAVRAGSYGGVDVVKVKPDSSPWGYEKAAGIAFKSGEVADLQRVIEWVANGGERR